jgi:hypothetical protein
MPTIFFSDKLSGTLADNEQALGLAEVLATWLKMLRRAAGGVRIQDCGSYFEIALPAAIEVSDIAQTTIFTPGRGQRLIKTEGEGFAYEQERQKRDAFAERLKKLAPADRKRYGQNPGADEFAEIESLKPHPLLGTYVSVSHFRATDAYNALIDQWEGGIIEGFRHNLAMLLGIFAQHPNHLADVEKHWSAGSGIGKAAASLLQVVNPSTGKGVNAPKANSVSAGNLDGFWLLEYLKFVGYFTIAAPVLLGDDRKTYVLHPRQVDLGVLHRLMDDFRESFRASSAVKTDILASLRFTRTFVRYREELYRTNAPDPLLAMFGQPPQVTDIADGFDLAFYKSMGNAFATMNLATINLPNWLTPITDVAQAQAAGALLDEHITVVASIKTSKGDEGSDEFELLRRYRDFLSGHDTMRFFEFAAHFGDYYLAHRHRNLWAGQFTTEGMRVLMAQTTKKLLPIIETPGFLEIASAIRNATVDAQYWAGKDKTYPYEVRYGLGQNLLRAAAYPDDCMAAISEFLHVYNAEVARVEERITKGSISKQWHNRRFPVSTGAIQELVKLVDAYGSEVICKMLVAYGYARDGHVVQHDVYAQVGDTDTDETTQAHV